MECSNAARLLVVSSTCPHDRRILIITWVLCSLKNHGVDAEVDGMFDMGAETMRLPLEEKMKFEQGKEGVSISAGSVDISAPRALLGSCSCVYMLAGTKRLEPP